MANPKSKESQQAFLKRCTTALMADGKKNQKQAFAECSLNWDAANDQRAALKLSADLELAEKGESGPRKFVMIGYSGQKVDRGWRGGVIIDVAGIETKAVIPVLRQHMSGSIVGSGIGSKQNNKFVVNGEFSEITEDAKEVLELADEGFPWQASVRVRPLTILEISDGQKAKVNGFDVEGPVEIWRKSTVFETSFVAIGEDDNTAAISLSDESYPVEILSEETTENIILTDTQEDRTMAEKLTVEELRKNNPELVTELLGSSADEGAKTALDLERDRVNQIVEAGADQELTNTAIKDGMGVTEFLKLALADAKTKTAAELKALETEAPDSLGGSDENDIDAETATLGALAEPDKEADKRAWAMVDEKGIEYAVALRAVFAADEKLAGAYEKEHIMSE